MRRAASDTPGFTAGQAMGVLAACFALLLLGGPLFAPAGMAGVLLAQVLFIGSVPVLAAVMHHGASRAALARALGLRRVPAPVLAGAACLGIGFWYLDLWLVVPVAERILGGEEELARLHQLVAQAPAWLALASLMLAPAVCEELLMRGVVARSLRPVLGRAGAICLSALLFALLHFSVARLLPTALFGAVLAGVAFAAGSIVPCILIHAVNNTLALLLAGDHLPPLAAAIDAHPHQVGVAALALALAGSALLYTQLRETPAHKKPS